MTTTYPISAAYSDGKVLSASNVNQIAGGVNDLAALQINAQTATYTLVLGDSAKLITMTSGSALTLNVPTNASVAFAIGTQIAVYQGGAGQVTIAAVTPGTTSIRSQGSKTKLNGQYSMAVLTKIATDEWVLTGNTSA
jgi:hypothetical protein